MAALSSSFFKGVDDRILGLEGGGGLLKVSATTNHFCVLILAVTVPSSGCLEACSIGESVRVLYS